MFKKTLYNTGWQVVGKGITASTTLLITLIIGRTLGPSGFGDFTKIFVFVGYFYTISDFGLNSIFIKLSKQQQSRTLFNTLLSLRLLVSFSLAIVSIIIALILPYDSTLETGFSPIVKTGIVIASLTIITQALFTTASALFQKKLRYDLSAYATVFGSIAIITATFIFSLIAKSILPFVFVYVIGGIVYVIASYTLIFSKLKESISPKFNALESKNLLTQSWPIGIALFLNLLYFRLDVLVLSSFRQSAEVGLYGLGYQFFQVGLALPIFFVNALYPGLVKIYKENLEKFRKTVKTWSIYLIGVSLIMTTVLFLISYTIPVIYDSRFAGSAIALRILALGMPFFFISALLWHLSIIYGKQKLLIYIYGFGAVFNLVANLLFIPTYGYVAAATTTIISEALVTVLLFWRIIKFRS